MIFMRAAIALFGSASALHRMIREPLEPMEAVGGAQTTAPAAAARTPYVPVAPSVGLFSSRHLRLQGTANSGKI